MPVRAIARQLGHSPQTVRDYLHQRRTPGVRAVSRPGLFTDLFADYCRQRFTEDPHLRPSSLFRELTGLGFRGKPLDLLPRADPSPAVPIRPPAIPDAGANSARPARDLPPSRPPGGPAAIRSPRSPERSSSPT